MVLVRGIGDDDNAAGGGEAPIFRLGPDVTRRASSAVSKAAGADARLLQPFRRAAAMLGERPFQLAPQRGVALPPIATIRDARRIARLDGE